MKVKSNKNNSFNEINTHEFLAKIRSSGESMNTAFKKMVQITHNPLMYYIKRFVRSEEEAQEVLQEVFLGVYKGLPKFQGNSKLSTWIYSLAHNKVCDKISDKKWQHEEFTEFKQDQNELPSWDVAVSKATEWDTRPDRLYSINQAKQQMPQMIAGLANNLKDVYVMRDVEGLNGAEVAEILNLTEEAVRVRLHRARIQIVESMQQYLSGKSISAQNLTGKGV